MKDFRSNQSNGSFILKGSNASSIILKSEQKTADMRTPKKEQSESNNK